MKVMNAREIEDRFGITEAELDVLECDASKGIFHGEPRGDVVVGRPLMFGEEMRQVGFKEPVRKIELIDYRARQLGLKRSDYLRYLVDQDLIAAGIV